MTSYVPRHSKKRERLERVESDLVRLLAEGVARSVVDGAAAKVRQAKVRALHARRAKVPPKAEFEQEIAAIDRGIEAWTQLPLEDLLSLYR